MAEGSPDRGTHAPGTSDSNGSGNGGRQRTGGRELSQRLPELLEAMVAIGGDADLQTLLDRIVEGAAGVTRARYAALAVMDDEGDVGELVTRGLDSQTRQQIARLPGNRGVLRRLLETRRSLLVDDLLEEPQFRGFPIAPDRLRSLLGVPVRVHDAGFGALYLASDQPGAFTDEDLRLVEILATEAGIALGNARLYDALRQRARWMDGNAELSTSLLSGDVDDALAVVAEQGKRLAEAEAGLVLMPDDNNGMRVVVACADDPGQLLEGTLPPDSQLLPPLLAGEPVFVEDAATDPRLASGLAARFGPAMVLPLANDGRILGALALLRAPGAAQYSLAERAMANQFAQQSAVALVLSEARHDRERLAVYQDRDRIARDLHDLVIQRLFATGMMLETAQRAAPTDVRRRVSKAVDELDATIQEIRTAIFALQQGPEEAPSGLRTRVLRETGAASRTLGFQPSVTFTGAVDTRVSEGVAKNLIAALREALSNVARHSGANRLEVSVDATAHLDDDQEAVRLTVTDDGTGLPAGETRRSGLRNIARRAETLGGRTEFGPGLGSAGTTLTWEVPL